MSFEEEYNPVSAEETYTHLKHEIHRLRSQVKYQEEMIRQLSGGQILNCEPIDLYPGEQHDLILSILEQARDKCQEGARARDILDSVLSKNEKIGVGDEILVKVKRVLRQGIPSKASDLSELSKLGFRYIQSKKHPKLVFYNRYTYYIAGTPGDSRRGNRNCYSELSKCIASSLKI